MALSELLSVRRCLCKSLHWDPFISGSAGVKNKGTLVFFLSHYVLLFFTHIEYLRVLSTTMKTFHTPKAIVLEKGSSAQTTEESLVVSSKIFKGGSLENPFCEGGLWRTLSLKTFSVKVLLHDSLSFKPCSSSSLKMTLKSIKDHQWE